MTQAKFKFTCDANGGDQFTVVSFTGCERVSELYRYDIEVKAPLTATIDLDDVLDSLVHFVIEQDGVEYPVNGILSSFEEFKTIKNYAHYKATLVPRIWKLTNYKTNEIFYSPGIEGELEQGQTVADIVTQVLEKSGMVSSEFDIAGLSGKLLKREYVCQYNESDFDFISRLLENEGIFYYFEQDDLDEKIVFVNDLNYLSIARPKLIFDVAAMSATQGDNVYAWSCRKQRLAERVVVRDYNPDEPSLDVSDTMPIDSMGQGTEYIYGKNVHSDGEATYLSEIRAEQHITRKTQFFGESSVTRLQSGYIFVLEQHPNTKYNGHEYLAIEVNHEGQSLDMAIDAGSQSDAKPQYQNSFVAILADTQFRPELKTKKPKITGTLHARIDGEMDSEYAQLDSEGRYKVSMPFDFHNENHPEGLASARVRMMQPYAGENRGMQFPMAKGTDVLLSFVDGDPDRPIIAGAINTTASPGPVTADNQTESVIQTGGNNKIRMGDEEGKERVVLSTPLSNSWIRMGAHNDPIILQGNATENVVLGDDYTEPNPAATTTRDGVTVNLSPIASVPPFDKDIAGTYRFIYTSAASSTGSDETAIRTVNVLLPSDNSEHEIADQDGIRIRSGSSLWLESGSRYGNYKSGVPSSTDFQRFPYERDTDANPAQVANMLENFGVAYSPTNLKNYKTGALAGTGANPGGTTTEAMVGQDVTVSSLDTFTTQEGNIYDFGGYWNYNLGNSYAEDHLSQKSILNHEHPYDLLEAGPPGSAGVIWRKTGSRLSSSLAKGEEEAENSGSPIERDERIGAHKDSDDWKTIWVQKTLGDSYEYTEGSTISVAKGGSQSIEIGGAHVEEAYRGDGSIKSRSTRGIDGDPAREEKWNKNGKRTYLSESTATEDYVNDLEQKFDRRTGALYSDSRSQGTGMGLSKFDFDYTNTISMGVNTGMVISMDSFLGGKMTMDNFVGGKMVMENFAGGSMTMENALGYILKMENAPIVFKNTNGSIETKVPGSALKAEASETTVALNAMKSSLSDINSPLFASLTAGLTSIA